jgi:protoporphyrinogen oxidase
MDFIFEKVLSQEYWHKVVRNAKINYHGHFISYPIEFAIKEIAEFDSDIAYGMTKDFFASENLSTNNLADWFIQTFGKTLAEEYFIPYNKKIWQMEPADMSHLWIDGKLPLPNKKDFFIALISDHNDQMPHSTFYYPNSNNQNTFIEALAKNLHIVTEYDVTSIQKTNDKWVLNGEDEFDVIINTTPLNELPKKLEHATEEVLNAAKKLKYNKLTNVLWKTKPIDFTWSYYPAKDTIFHRHIHIGNFFNTQENYTITESMGEHTFDEMIEHGKKFDYLLEPIDYHQSEHAYVVYDQNYQSARKTVIDYIEKIGLYSIGRFGEWEYYNMDICMESAMKLANDLKKGIH